MVNTVFAQQHRCLLKALKARGVHSDEFEQFIDITIKMVANWEEAAKKKSKEKLLREKRTKMMLLTLGTGENSDIQKSK